MSLEEEWRPVVGWEGLYEVSSRGRVKRVERVKVQSNGREVRYEERKKKLVIVDGYPRAQLYDGDRIGQRNVHILMAEAFLPNPDNLPVVRHLNDIRTDNRLENLAWGTYSDNTLDALKNKRNYYANRTHCPKGHEYAGSAGYVNPRTGHRSCKPCSKENKVKNRNRGLPQGDPRHGTNNAYDYWGCRCSICMTNKNTRQQEYRRKKREKREERY